MLGKGRVSECFEGEEVCLCEVVCSRVYVSA